MQLLILRRGKIPEDARIQLLRRKAGLQINADFRVCKTIIRHMGAGRKNERPGNAEMGEQHFSQLTEFFLSLFQKGDPDIFQGKPRETAADLLFPDGHGHK